MISPNEKHLAECCVNCGCIDCSPDCPVAWTMEGGSAEVVECRGTLACRIMQDCVAHEKVTRRNNPNYIQEAIDKLEPWERKAIGLK